MGCLKTIYCRGIQQFVKIGNDWTASQPPELLCGAGCIRQLPEKIREAGVRRLLIVCGPHIFRSGLLNGFLEALEQAQVSFTVFSEIQSNPTDENVEAGLAVLRRDSCEGIAALGGGSPMDCAKAIAARAAHPEKSAAQLQGVLKVRREILPLWAIPTTAGTGSEATIAAVITISVTRHKAAISDPVLVPKCAVLDPELTLALSPALTAATGMDALCHAVEAYTNWTYCTEKEKQLARDSVRLIYENLIECFRHGENIEARQNMLLASYYAGRAFTRGCVGTVHACGHPLSALYGLHHGMVMGALLPRVLRAYGAAIYPRLAELASCCGMTGADEAEKAEAFLCWIESLNQKMGIPASFQEIREADISQMAEWADCEANPLYPVPVIWPREEFIAFYRSLRETPPGYEQQKALVP